MKTKTRKGFTLVELVIVIAVIAILAAVLIPTFSNLLRKSQVSTDTQLIRNLNVALEMDKANGNKHETMHSALECAKEAGYDISRINAQATNNEILWDSVNDVFCYLNDNKIEYIPDTKVNKDSIETYEYWRIYDKMPEVQSYSIYWNSDNTLPENTTFTVGFDAGYNEEVFLVNYTGKENSQKITIRTNGQHLTIGETNDHIKHFGLVRDLNVTKVDDINCYYEYGYVGVFESFINGKYIASKAKYHQNEKEITNVLGENNKTLTKVIYGEHYYGKDGKCLFCDAYDHEHNYEEEITKAATCTEAGEKSLTCTICGATTTEDITALDHNWEETYLYNEFTHWYKCTRCDAKNSETEHYMTWTQVDKNDHKGICSICNREIKESHNIENGVCTKCNFSASKNGLVDGLYYKDDELYTGSETDGGETYTFKDGRLIVKYSSAEQSDFVDEKDGFYTDNKYTYDIPTNESFVTKEIILATDGEKGFNQTAGYAEHKPGFNILNTIVIDSTNEYNIKEFSTIFEGNVNGAIKYLINNIGEKNKDEILNTLKDTYGLDDSYYPTMTYSDDFANYLKSIGIDSQNITENQYNSIKKAETSFGSYLKTNNNLKEESSILELDWNKRFDYNFNNQGIYYGNVMRDSNGDAYTFDDPEIILLYLFDTYNYVFYAAASTNLTNINKIPSSVNNYYSAIWITAISNSYEDVKFDNLYEFSINKNDMENNTLKMKQNTYYFLFSSNQNLMCNIHQGRSFPAPSFEIIIENTNYGNNN